MSLEEKIFNTFRNVGIKSGEEILIPASHVLKFIETCKQYKVAVQGFEGFEVQSGEIIPRMDLIADFSEIKAKNWEGLFKKSHQHAYQILLPLCDLENLAFSFILMDKGEFEKK